jgi:hypothetical protein
MKLEYKGHFNTRNKFSKRFFPNLKISLPILDELEESRFWGIKYQRRRPAAGVNRSQLKFLNETQPMFQTDPTRLSSNSIKAT